MIKGKQTKMTQFQVALPLCNTSVGQIFSNSKKFTHRNPVPYETIL